MVERRRTLTGIFTSPTWSEVCPNFALPNPQNFDLTVIPRGLRKTGSPLRLRPCRPSQSPSKPDDTYPGSLRTSEAGENWGRGYKGRLGLEAPTPYSDYCTSAPLPLHSEPGPSPPDPSPSPSRDTRTPRGSLPPRPESGGPARNRGDGVGRKGRSRWFLRGFSSEGSGTSHTIGEKRGCEIWTENGGTFYGKVYGVAGGESRNGSYDTRRT